MMKILIGVFGCGLVIGVTTTTAATTTTNSNIYLKELVGNITITSMKLVLPTNITEIFAPLSVHDQNIASTSLSSLLEKNMNYTSDRLNEIRSYLANIKGINGTLLDYIDNNQDVADELLNQFAKKYIIIRNLASKEESRYRGILLVLRYLRVVQMNAAFGNVAQFKLNPLAFVSTNPAEWSSVTGFSYSAKEYPSLGLRSRRRAAASVPSSSPTPASIDWRDASPVVLSPIQNQGNCGACWAFAATCVAESRFAITKQDLTSLSMQQLVSCDVNGGDSGCNGGNPVNAYMYMYKNQGVTSYEQYPYLSVNGGPAPACNTQDSDLQLVQAGNAHMIIPTTDDEIIQGLQTGPVSIAVVASNPCFQHYTSGIIMAANCAVTNPPQLDHAIVIVGYTTMAGSNGQQVPVFIIRNSWGTSWGESGYAYFQRGVPYPGTLGCLASAAYPDLVELSAECDVSNPPAWCAQLIGNNPPTANSAIDHKQSTILAIGIVLMGSLCL
jgi:KDEL-tailed cysteine endopeptidase